MTSNCALGSADLDHDISCSEVTCIAINPVGRLTSCSARGSLSRGHVFRAWKVP